MSEAIPPKMSATNWGNHDDESDDYVDDVDDDDENGDDNDGQGEE